MKTSNQLAMNQQNQINDSFNCFNNSRLDHQEMYAVRGGGEDIEDHGSVADVQDDGFN